MSRNYKTLYGGGKLECFLLLLSVTTTRAKGVSFEWRGSTWPGCSLAGKYYTRVEVTDSDKHCNLFLQLHMKLILAEKVLYYMPFEPVWQTSKTMRALAE